MDASDKLLIDELRRDEGVRYSPFLDTVGILTSGVGHNMEERPLPEDWKFPLSDTQVNMVLAHDLSGVFKDLDTFFPWWRKLSYARQRVCANMVFNLGIVRFQGFKNTIEFIKSGQYEKAANAMLSSKWAQQVGERAKRLAKMMKDG